MKKTLYIILQVCLVLCVLPISSCSDNDKAQKVENQNAYTIVKTDSLPKVLPANASDITASRLRLEAQMRFSTHVLPDSPEKWKDYSETLRNTIIEKAGVRVNHQLPLNVKETGNVKLKGYSVKNISFQTLPGVHATANLYVPDGRGPFPGIVYMLGHWTKGKIDTAGPQAVGHSLALNGYVCLTIDPWGAGERSTKHGEFEYHGAGLGASLMNIGQPLIGIQISENMRAVDLLCSLPFVDSLKIGATGASGGGNQSMWLAATDERIKAVVPVVSVGTFESYVMRSNCICELLNDGLTFTEEAGVLALARAVMPCNHTLDIETFHPSETARTYDNAVSVFRMMGKEKNISRKVFELTHGYFAEDRQAMLGWFNLHLKGIGDGTPKKELPFTQLPEEKLMVFPIGQRDGNVISTDEYCRIKGNELRSDYLNLTSFNAGQKKSELKDILRIHEDCELRNVHRYAAVRGWERYVLETADNRLIPVLHLAPQNDSKHYVVIVNPEGKESIPHTDIDKYREQGSGIIIADLSGTGEMVSSSSITYDQTAKLHTLSRAELWLGKTVQGEWVRELSLIVRFINTTYKPDRITVDGYKEAGVAGLFLAALEGNVEDIILRNSPVSYLFDNRESVDYFSMAIHLPGFLNWGDISLAAAIGGKNITFINPVTISGTSISEEETETFRKEYYSIRKKCNLKGNTTFI